MFFLCFLLISGMAETAWAQELQVGGIPVGISVDTGGLIVTGVSSVETVSGSISPAEEAGIKAGDYIIGVNGEDIASTEVFLNTVQNSGGSPVTLSVSRSGKECSFTVTPALSKDGQWMLGLWLKKGISGIGTVTFYDPDTGIYGALGHCISAENGGAAVDLEAGIITEAQIVSVTPGTSGQPGELNGCSDTASILGSVDTNTSVGIFGISDADLGGSTLETGEMHVGKAAILTTVCGCSSAEYSVTIDRLYTHGEHTYAQLTVTDDALISISGGIVQGMSGSPIIQDGRLVGAVTHVFVSDSKKGYGVSIQDMLSAAGMAA